MVTARHKAELEGKLTAAAADVKALQASIESLKEKTKTVDELKSAMEEDRTKFNAALHERDKKIIELSGSIAAQGKAKPVFKRKTAALETPSPAASGSEAQLVERTRERETEKSGKILVVKPERGIAVINLGKKHGVKIDSIFYIYGTGSRYMGKLIIDEVEDTVSIGKIDPADIADKVKEDFLVILK